MKLLLIATCFFIQLSTYSQQESPEQRITHYTLEINLHPDSIQNYIARSKAYAESKNYLAAIEDCDKALHLNPNDKHALGVRAYSYYWTEKYDSSIHDIDEILRQNANDAQAWNQRGLDYYWKNEVEKSIGDFTEALNHEPGNASFWFNRGNSYYWLKNFDKAIGDFSESLTYDGKNMQAIYTRGMCYFYQKKYAEALTDFNSAYNLNPDNDVVLTARGNCYRMLKQPDAALADFSKALQINPVNQYTWNDRGNVYKDQEAYNLAIADYTQSVLLNPKYNDAIFNRANIYLKMHKPEEAIKDYTQVLSTEAASATVLGNRGDAYVMAANYPLAIKDYNAALKIDPKDNEVLTSLGTCYKKTGDKKLALQYLNEAVSLNPVSVFSLQGRGDYYSSVLDYENAVQDYSAAINADPKAYAPRNNRGNIFFNQKKYDLALSDYTVIIANNPSLAIAYSNRGYVYKFQKKYAEALSDFRKSISLDPLSGVTLDKMGAVYMDMFQYDSAMWYFNKALRINPSDTNILNDRGLCYSNQKKYAEAIIDFTEAIKINPAFTSALNNRALIYYKKGMYDIAIADLKKGIQARSTVSQLYINLILVYLASDRLNEASQVYEKYNQLQLSSYMDEFSSWSFLKKYINACCNYLVKKDYEKALPLLEASLEEYKEANQTLNPGVAISMEYSNVLIKIAMCNEALGRTEKALEFYKKAIVISPALTALNGKIEMLSNKLKTSAKQNNTSPQIQLLTPAPTRGNTIDVDNSSADLFISGTVKDNTGISWVKINGQDISVQPGGYFSTNIKSNFSALTIQSANTNNLITSVAYTIQKAGGSKGSDDDIPAIPASVTPRFHAILIACSNYNGDKWKKLPTTKDEADAYKEVLEKYYGFKKDNVVEMFDGQRRDILNLISSSIQSLDSNDNLIIMFAGHGTYVKGNDGVPPIGYWVPVNAEGPVDYISNGNLSDIMYGSKTRHILLISDACYSAAMRGNDDEEMARLSEKNDWQFTSRQILTSGGLEKVPGESVFINMVIKALEINNQKHLSAKALYNLIFTGVKNQTDTEPELNIFGKDGNQGGQFYFIKQ